MSEYVTLVFKCDDDECAQAVISDIHERYKIYGPYLGAKLTGVGKGDMLRSRGEMEGEARALGLVEAE